MAEKDGGPAFPVATTDPERGHQCGASTWQFPGMSLRAHYAGLAMQAFLTGHISHLGHEEHWPFASLASSAFCMADAMLAELQKSAAPAAVEREDHGPALLRARELLGEALKALEYVDTYAQNSEEWWMLIPNRGGIDVAGRIDPVVEAIKAMLSISVFIDCTASTNGDEPGVRVAGIGSSKEGSTGGGEHG